MCRDAFLVAFWEPADAVKFCIAVQQVSPQNCCRNHSGLQRTCLLIFFPLSCHACKLASLLLMSTVELQGLMAVAWPRSLLHHPQEAPCTLAMLSELYKPPSLRSAISIKSSMRFADAQASGKLLHWVWC